MLNNQSDDDELNEFLETTIDMINNKKNDYLYNIDGGISQKLLEYFQQSHKQKDFCGVVSLAKLQKLEYDSKKIIKIIEVDSRFIEISKYSYGLIEWLFDELDNYIKIDDTISFNRIKMEAKKVYKLNFISISNLRKFFPSKYLDYDYEYLINARKAYIEKDIDALNLLTGRNILIDEILKIKNEKIITDLESLKAFGMEKGYVYYDDIEKIDIKSDYDNMTELLIDFNELGINLIER